MGAASSAGPDCFALSLTSLQSARVHPPQRCGALLAHLYEARDKPTVNKEDKRSRIQCLAFSSHRNLVDHLVQCHGVVLVLVLLQTPEHGIVVTCRASLQDG